MDFPQKLYLKEHCPKLVRFMDHFQQKYFNDWDTLCEQQPNHVLQEDSPWMQQLAKKLRIMKYMTAAGAASLVATLVVVVARNNKSNSSRGGVGSFFKQLLIKSK
tara:strand:+ start:564 stop:878 length:315 start_codon:yes stop_codon:yes gene_type:complete